MLVLYLLFYLGINLPGFQLAGTYVTGSVLLIGFSSICCTALAFALYRCYEKHDISNRSV